MKLHKVILFIIILPIAIILDLVIYALVKQCPTCGSFGTFVKTEGALSFPFIVGLSDWLRMTFNNLYILTKREKK